jgi:hypothetical protein
MRDLDFISGEFFEVTIPKEKRYLKKYFTGKLQIAFLRYYLVFGNCKNFRNHTGYRCCDNLCVRLENRYKKLTKLYDDAKSSFTEEGLNLLQLIELGKYNLTKLPKS